MKESQMKIASLLQSTILISVFISVTSAQHLPRGAYHPNRDRTYDIMHYEVDLQLDWKNVRVNGEATIRLRPLRALSSISLDAYWLSVARVRRLPEGKDLTFTSTDSTLVINLNKEFQPTDTLTVVVKYSATPTAGLYFIDPPRGSNSLPSIFT